MKHLLALIVISLALLGCSTAPEESAETSQKKNQAAEYIIFGNNYYEQSQYGQALNFFNLALDLNISVHNEPGIAKNYNSIGKTYLALGDEAQAELYFQRAYELAQDLGVPELIYQSAYNMGEIYLRKRDTESARTLMEEALNRAGVGDPTKELAIIQHGMGMVYRYQGMAKSDAGEDAQSDFDTSVDYFQKALNINKSLGAYGQMASNYFMMASVEHRRENLTRARELAVLALENDRLVENSAGIALDLVALGILDQKLGNPEIAYDNFFKAFRIYQTLELASGLLRTAEYLAPLAEQLDKTGEAEYYRSVLEQLGN